MKAAAVHHLLPSQQQQANTSVSKNDKYSGTIPPSQVMEEPVPPKTCGICLGAHVCQYHETYIHWNTIKRQHKLLKEKKKKKGRACYVLVAIFLFFFHLCWLRLATLWLSLLVWMWLLCCDTHPSIILQRHCDPSLRFAGPRFLYRGLMDCVDCAVFISLQDKKEQVVSGCQYRHTHP